MSGELIGSQSCASHLNYGEGMLAGGGCVAGVCTPAKPRWSEVIVFLDVLLRREDRYPEENVTSEALKKWKYNILV
jgi:hypothetical protein